MKYAIYTLKFLTPVHFGNSANGGSLEKTSLICSADTYFSALCWEASLFSDELVEQLVEKFNSGKLSISSLFPFCTKDTDFEFYLPKPFLQAEIAREQIQPFSVMKEDMIKLKQMKKTSFIRASKMKDFMTAVNHKQFFNINEPLFAYKETNTKVNTRLTESMPYFINTYHFVDNAGLYFVVAFEDEEDLSMLDKLIKSLGYSGIGGKHSSGYGKYEFAGDEFTIYDEEDGIYEDAIALIRALKEKGRFQLNIAPVAPLAKDVTDIKFGFYKLTKRSGFVYADKYDNYVKKNNIYMIAEGSCFLKRIQGNMIEEQIEGVSHKIYRNGLGMFVGLNYE